MRERRELVHVDADGEGVAAHRLPVGAVHVVAQVLAMGLVAHVVLEVLHVLLRLEADQVVREQRAHQPFMLRNGRDDDLRWQRNVQEEADALLAAHGAQLGGQRHQVVVVDPDDVVVLQQRHQLAREQLVHAAVAADEAGIEMRQVQAVVEHRPEHVVAVAQVVAVVVVATQVERGERHLAGLLLVQLAFARGAALDDLPAPAEPQAAALLQALAQGHGQAAGGGLARVGHAVRNNDETTHMHESQGADRRTAALMMPTIE
ncbi:hypothetical protein D3C72_1261390 [compost metagenome]